MVWLKGRLIVERVLHNSLILAVKSQDMLCEPLNLKFMRTVVLVWTHSLESIKACVLFVVEVQQKEVKNIIVS
jgi:hypothetical protein